MYMCIYLFKNFQIQLKAYKPDDPNLIAHKREIFSQVINGNARNYFGGIQNIHFPSAICTNGKPNMCCHVYIENDSACMLFPFVYTDLV